MSKKPKNILIEVNELKGKSTSSWEVIAPNKKATGIIEEVEGRYRATANRSNNVLFLKSLENSINDLLSYFAFHEK